MSTTTQAAETGTGRRPYHRIRTRALTVVAAIVAALAAWAVAVPVAGAELAVRTGSIQQVGPASVVIAGVLAGLIGWALLAALERFTPRARAVWTTVALGVLLLSFAGPLGAATTAAMVALACMHAVVGAVLVTGLARSAAAR